MTRMTSIHLFTGFLLAFVLAGLSSEARGQERYAIVVGHDLGLPDEEPLRFAERDARRFLDTLIELGDVDEKNTILLLGKKPVEVNAALDRMAEELSKDGATTDATLFFYYAGHGDAEFLHLGPDKLARSALIEQLKEIPVSLKLVVLDACHTATTGRMRGARTGKGFDIGVVRSDEHRGLVLIRSTQEGEPAHESDRLEGSVFTHYLVSALRGAADVDRNGLVTLMEAYAFAFRHTVRHSGGTSSAVQHPSFELELAGSGELVITRPSGARAILVIPAGPHARLLVFQQPSGTVVAEVVRSPEQAVELAVPPGRLLVQRKAGARFGIAEVELPFGGRLELSDADFTDQPYEKVVRRGADLELHPNGLDLDYLYLAHHLPGDWVLRQGVHLAYTLDLSGRWEWGVGLSSTWSQYQQARFDWAETVVGLTGFIGYRIPAGVTSIQLRAGPEGSLIFQSRARSDREELEQIGIESASRGRLVLGAGAGFELRWWIPLGGRFGLQVGFRVSLLALNVENETGSTLRAIPVIGGEVGFGHRF